MSIPNILAPEQLATIKQAFQGSSMILEHAYINGGRAPDSIVVDDYEELEEYLRTKVAPGDFSVSGDTTICAAARLPS